MFANFVCDYYSFSFLFATNAKCATCVEWLRSVIWFNVAYYAGENYKKLIKETHTAAAAAILLPKKMNKKQLNESTRTKLG